MEAQGPHTKGWPGAGSTSDRHLWERMQSGDPSALEGLFKRHYPFLYDYGVKFSQRPELVRDAIQDLFAYIWERRGQLAEVLSVRAYLMISLRRMLLKKLQRQTPEDTAIDLTQLERPTGAFSPEDFMIYQEKMAEERRIIREGILKIPEKLREALYLRTYQGLSYTEIAYIMDISPQVARNYVSQAFRRLRKLILEKLRRVYF
ncbi:MAG: sigma-70 family RNA polymerase sigma factor [Calditrichaeota bacterium]|nr:sigma-70 family RNA polymerase sigma factor [Calditrichota bacterium]